jgi:hypothetical protein
MTSHAYETILVSDLPGVPQSAPVSAFRALVRIRMSERRERRAFERAMAIVGPREAARMQVDFLPR